MRLLKKIMIALLCAMMGLHTGVYTEDRVQAKKSDPVLLKISGSGTLNIYEDKSLTNVVTYISKSGTYTGDMALLGETSNAYHVRIAGYTGWVRKESGLTPLKLSEITSPSYYAVNSSNELYHRISTNPTGTTYATSPVLGPAPKYLKKGVNYYSYDGIYFYEDFQDMINDYIEEDSDDAVNDGDPYYNYYLYLPFHAPSNYDASDLNEYMEDVLKWKDKPDHYPAGTYESMLYDEAEAFYEIQEEYGTNMLLMFAIAMNESAGRSQYAIEKNNLFGLNAVDANPDSANDYDSIADCVEKFATYHINWGYLDYYDARYFGGHVGNKGSGINVKYASDPYWGEKAAMYYYRVDKALGMKDYESYTIGIHESDAKYQLLRDAKKNSKVTAAIAHVAAMPYVILSENDGYYKVTTDFQLDDNRLVLKHDDSLWYMPFDFKKNYAYIASDELYVTGDVKIDMDQEIKIEDAALLAAINQELGRQSDAVLSTKDVRLLKKLTLDLKDVKTLNGIEQLPQLSELTLSGMSADLNTSALGACDLNVLEIQPNNQKQLQFLEDGHFKQVILADFTLTDRLSAKNIGTLVIDGGSNVNLTLLSDCDVNKIEVIHQQVNVELNNDGEVFTYVNQFKDANGNFISLADVNVYADGKKVTALYDEHSRTLTIQAASSSEITMEIDATLKGKVKTYTASLSAKQEVKADLSKNGWQQLANNWVYVSNGALHKGWLLENGTWYYFKNDGTMATGWFMDEKMCWYFMDYASGAMKIGWAADGKDWYYLNPDNGIMQTGWQTIANQRYYLWTSGAKAGSMAIGMVDIEGMTYEFNANGVLIREVGAATSKPETPNEKPDLNEKPTEPEGPSHPDEPLAPETPNETVKNWWIKESDGWTFYQNGQVVENVWVADYKNDWFFAGKNGKMVANDWIARDSSLAVWYYVDETGAMVYGPTTIQGYFINEKGEYHS